MAGYLSVKALAESQAGMPQLVAGIEYSCVWSGATIHILGYGINCEHPAMVEGLTRLATARLDRAEKIASRLAACGFEGALEGALAEAGDSQVGRPHFASWMIAQGHVPDANTAFDKYLGQGKTGDVKAFWPTLAEAVSWIVDSGGTAVIAHPLKYKFTRMKLGRLAMDFKAAGGEAPHHNSARLQHPVRRTPPTHQLRQSPRPRDGRPLH